MGDTRYMNETQSPTYWDDAHEDDSWVEAQREQALSEFWEMQVEDELLREED